MTARLSSGAIARISSRSITTRCNATSASIPHPSIKTTWEQYLRIAKWFNANQDDVPYGTGHQAKQFTALNDDFADVLWGVRR